MRPSLNTRMLAFIVCVVLLSACIPSTAVSSPDSQASDIPTSLPTLTPTSTAVRCQQIQGRFENGQLQSSMRSAPLDFRVYLPPCYPQAGYRYPVLYLLHGQLFKLDQWERLGAPAALEELMRTGNAPPFIIVMPQEPDGLATQWESKYGDIIPMELVPLIDQTYQTCTERTCRAIGGLSRGAGWAARIALINWQTFGAVGLHSFAPFRGDWNTVPIWVREIPKEQLPRIYLDIGVQDFMLDAATEWEIRLKNYSVPHEWHINLGTHDEEYWMTHVNEYILWYGSAWMQPYLDYLKQQGINLERSAP